VILVHAEAQRTQRDSVLSRRPPRPCVHLFPSPPDRRPDPYRHPELVSGSIYQPKTSVCVARWMLNQVQHDDRKSAPFYFRRPSAGWGLSRLSAKWFAQRHEGIKKLLLVFVSSCEPKSCRARKDRAMGSRFRGNDNVGVLGRVNGYSRRPKVTSVLIYVST
jgi:hypothetical protein